MSPHVPARWRLVSDNDHLKRWQCDGDGVDLCRAPATWVAEHEANGTLHVVGQRCPDHVPVRAFRGLSTLPAPAQPSTPPVEPLASLPVTPPADETGEEILAVTAEHETDPMSPGLADTQPADKFRSPPPPPQPKEENDDAPDER